MLFSWWIISVKRPKSKNNVNTWICFVSTSYSYKYFWCFFKNIFKRRNSKTYRFKNERVLVFISSSINTTYIYKDKVIPDVVPHKSNANDILIRQHELNFRLIIVFTRSFYSFTTKWSKRLDRFRFLSLRWCAVNKYETKREYILFESIWNRAVGRME